ncbi:MAG: tetraacyldisaccharide 4'-kinase [Parvibaculales bacterium]
MAEPRFWQTRHHLLSLALSPLSLLYGGLEAARRKLTHAQHPGKPVICIGNLTAGGGGKTPTVRWLAEKMAAQGKQPAILSRGYGGSEKGPLKVDPTQHMTGQVGDEPLMLATDWPVYIGADRMQSLRRAVQDGADMLIKDDGFQNPSLAHHFNLIVVDGASGLGNQRLLPAGPMRQPLSVALQKLDALLVIGAARHHSLAFLMDAVEAFGKPVFTAEITSHTKGKGAVHGFCGIAKPEKFRASLEAQGYEIDGFTSFADHHDFTEAEAATLLAHDMPLITTEKDMARLRGAPADSARARLAAEAAVLPITLKVENEADLLHAIEAAIADGQANRLYKSY